MRSQRVEVDAPDNPQKRTTALMLAAQQGSTAATRALLAGGASAGERASEKSL
jgi:hypothetical protein